MKAKKCSSCKSDMVKKIKTVVANTAGTTALASGDSVMLLSSASAQPNSGMEIGQSFTQQYWYCTNPQCGLIIMNS